MKQLKTALHLCFALSLAACGGGGLTIDLPGGGGGTLQLQFSPGQAVEHRLPFRIDGGLPPYTSSIEDCPDWVTLFADQGVLAGTAPPGTGGRTFFCTYRVTESDPGLRPQRSVTYGLRLIVGSTRDTLSLTSPGKQGLVVGVFHDEAFPEASGGVAPYTYALTCAGGSLPPGMGFAARTRRFAGTPTVRFRDSCTYTVTDSAQPAATASIAVEVEVTGAAIQPLVLPLLDKVNLSVGTFDDEEFPAATGGVQPYTYSFTCAGGVLPSGMGFAARTRRFAGTPTVRFRDSCTYTVIDSAQPPETVSHAVEVQVTGGAEPLALTRIDDLTLKIGRRSQKTFPMASGGVAPYTYELVDCTLPAGLEFHPSTRVLSGTPDAEYRGPNCTYRVTDSSSPQRSVSQSFVLIVEPLEEANDWRFRTRTVEPGGPCALPGSGSVEVAILPRAHRREGAASEAHYALSGVPHPPEANAILAFEESSRVLTYGNPTPPPVLGTPNTYRYLVGTADSVNVKDADDALCLDIQYVPRSSSCDDNPPLTHIQILLHVRDDAFWDENAQEYRCPDTTAPTPRSGAQGSLSNPVHEALGPVHARRASSVAHAAVRERVFAWSPGAGQASSAIVPKIGLTSLSGQSEGFDYRGTSESASFGAETGAGAWQAGLVASFTRTELNYRAEAALAERGYRTGEHDTEILSLHPFAAWHASSGGHLWASFGVGPGSLRHRDDLGFRSRSRSDVRLFAYAVGASVPVADMLSGELQAEAGIESFALDITGGDRISSSLPTLKGRDWRAGLTWSAPVSGAPSVSMAYRHLTGDGPEGGRLEARGSVAIAGLFDPRLSLIGSAETSLGLGDYEQNSWGFGGGVRFVPNGGRHGFGLSLDTHLASSAEEGSADLRLRGEAGYGLPVGPFLGTVRPYAKMILWSGDQSVQGSLGVDLRDTENSKVKLEAQAHSRDRSSAIVLSLGHRF